MGKRIRLFSIGLILGILLVFMMFGDREFSCNVRPNERVLNDIRAKKIFLTKSTLIQLKALNLSDKFIYDKVFFHGDVNFQESDAQKEPCPTYKIYYPKETETYYILCEKCREVVTVNGIFKTKK